MLYQHKSTILLLYYYFTTAIYVSSYGGRLEQPRVQIKNKKQAEGLLDESENVESKKIKIKGKIKK